MPNFSFSPPSALRHPRRALLLAFYSTILLLPVTILLVDKLAPTWLTLGRLLLLLLVFLITFVYCLGMSFGARKTHKTRDYRFTFNYEGRGIVEMHLTRLNRVDVGAMSFFKQIKEATKVGIEYANQVGAKRLILDSPLLVDRATIKLFKLIAPSHAGAVSLIQKRRLCPIVSVLAYRQIHLHDPYLSRWSTAICQGWDGNTQGGAFHL